MSRRKLAAFRVMRTAISQQDIVRLFGAIGRRNMLWKRILVGVVAAVFFSGMFTVLAHQSLVQMFGKHVGSVKYGRSLTEHSYAVDQKAK